MGHPPPAPPVWAVPHLDFHFYILERDAVRQIRPGPCSELIHCDDFKRAQIPVPKEYVHADHSTSVPRSRTGNHLMISKSPELVTAGRIFTHTFIFGAYDGRMTFYEPMITRAYLESRPDLCVPIKQPQAWAIEGYYPTTYCIRYSPPTRDTRSRSGVRAPPRGLGLRGAPRPSPPAFVSPDPGARAHLPGSSAGGQRPSAMTAVVAV